jgi:hypothetical protein
MGDLQNGVLIFTPDEGGFASGPAGPVLVPIRACRGLPAA